MNFCTRVAVRIAERESYWYAHGGRRFINDTLDTFIIQVHMEGDGHTHLETDADFEQHELAGFIQVLQDTRTTHDGVVETGWAQIATEGQTQFQQSELAPIFKAMRTFLSGVVREDSAQWGARIDAWESRVIELAGLILGGQPKPESGWFQTLQVVLSDGDRLEIHPLLRPQFGLCLNFEFKRVKRVE